MNVPKFLIWHCAGCGAPAEGRRKPCGCPTNVGTREGPNGRREQTFWDSVLGLSEKFRQEIGASSAELSEANFAMNAALQRVSYLRAVVEKARRSLDDARYGNELLLAYVRGDPGADDRDAANVQETIDDIAKAIAAIDAAEKGESA